MEKKTFIRFIIIVGFLSIFDFAPVAFGVSEAYKENIYQVGALKPVIGYRPIGVIGVTLFQCGAGVSKQKLLRISNRGAIGDEFGAPFERADDPIRIPLRQPVLPPFE